MLKYIIISDTMEKVPNPFVIGIVDGLNSVSDDITYLIHTAEKAAELYLDFNYLSNHIKDNFFWFETVDELNSIIHKNIRTLEQSVKVVTSPADLNLDGDVFYTHQDGKMYLLNNGNVYHADLMIVSRLCGKRIDLPYVVEDNFKGFRELKVTMKELGLLDEIYTEQSFMKYLEPIGMEYAVLFMYRDVWAHKEDYIYDIEDTKYTNPYDNILFVEDYLTNQPLYNIDLDKVEEYDLKFGKLPARYEYNGFYTTTGRIYCSSRDYVPIQNIQASKRDILFAEKDTHLVEFDYKAFEFDILCQVVGIEVEEDPHTAIYQRVVGIDFPGARTIGKKINYSFIFGQGESRLADAVMNDLPYVPAGFKELFLERLGEEEVFLHFKELEDRLRSQARNGTIRNYFGRLIHFKKDYAVLNNYVQSTAADILYIKFREVLDILTPRDKIILQNHDSLLMQLCNDTIESPLFDEIIRVMSAPVSGISGRVEYKYGLNWKSMM